MKKKNAIVVKATKEWNQNHNQAHQPKQEKGPIFVHYITSVCVCLCVYIKKKILINILFLHFYINIKIICVPQRDYWMISKVNHYLSFSKECVGPVGVY